MEFIELDTRRFTREGLLVLLGTILVPIAGFRLADLFC